MSLDRAKSDLESAEREALRLSTALDVVNARIARIKIYIDLAEEYSEPSVFTLAPDRIGGDQAKPRANASPLVPFCIEFIRQRGSRVHTRILLEELEKRGMQVGGTNKVTNLSGALSRAPELSSSRLEGWGLVEWENLDKARADFSEVNVQSLASDEMDGEIQF